MHKEKLNILFLRLELTSAKTPRLAPHFMKKTSRNNLRKAINIDFFINAKPVFK